MKVRDLPPFLGLGPVTPANLLPGDGVALLHPHFLAPGEADLICQHLFLSIPWLQDEVVMFGRTIRTARQISWHGDAGCDYRYSGRTKLAQPWSPGLLHLKSLAERAAGSSFNSCLLNLYLNGTHAMGWHSDDEPEMGRENTIASISLGAERRFKFRHKTGPHQVTVALPHGSLLIMSGSTQTHWQHCLPKSSRVTTPRINLTFRQCKPWDSTVPSKQK